METKIVIIKDRRTEYGAILTRITSADCDKHRILRQAGYFDGDFVFYQPLAGFARGQSHTDPFIWADRTNSTAHMYAKSNWDNIENVIDVQVILGD
jgi:hypothetical protein